MSLRNRLRGRRDDGALRAELSRGGLVRVPCRIRRTSARGWGPWTEAVVTLGAVPDGEARWSTDDAVAVGFASTNPHVDLAFEDVSDVFLRSVRFRTEAFWGMENDIVVVVSERGTIEVAVTPGDAEAVAARIDELARPAS
ncbi:hypothetical protein ACE2AJ_06020 [Aquihabitans daechungensis]|uniref:hypothetical protein n=1 Tax=Aquihabitans daechungensis TaxID=1052257 RepID=UPI003BA25EE9